MKRFFVNNFKVINNQFEITGSEHNHLKNVMRLCVGDDIIVVTGDIFDYYGKIEKIDKNRTICNIEKSIVNNKNPKTNVTVFNAIVKKDNMALIVQKLNEIGVTSLIPFENEFITAKSTENKKDKLQEIANQSCKQCGRSIPLNVCDCIKFNSLIKKLVEYDIVLFANEVEQNQSISSVLEKVCENSKIAIIIGSEGGFSEKEVVQLKEQKNVVSFSIGKRILRAETASIVVSSIVLFKMGEFEF